MSQAYEWQAKSALFVALGVMTGTILPIGMTAPSFAKSQFYDTRGYWNQACIEDLAQQKIISGYPDGSFRPQFPVTRAQFAAMVSKAFPDAARVRSSSQFIDVPLYSWAYDPIRAAFQKGFLSGYPGYNFRPHRGISRAQALVALASGLNYAPTRSATTVLYTYFSDAKTIPLYAHNGVAAASERQLVVNYPNVKLLRPNKSAKRAEVASFLCQALGGSKRGSLVPPQYIVGLSSSAFYPRFRTLTTFDNSTQ